MQWRGSKARLLHEIRSLPGYLSGRLPDPTNTVVEVYHKVGLALFAVISEAYHSRMVGGTDSAGLSWPPLVPFTIREKKKLRLAGEAEDILLRSGRLLLSLTPDSLSPHQIFNVSPGHIEVGTSLGYATTHMQGDPSIRTPRRQLWADWADWPDMWKARVTAPFTWGARTLLERIAATL